MSILLSQYTNFKIEVMMDKQKLTIEYARKALKSNSTNGFAYTSLAEAYALTSDDENFYINIEQALKLNFPVWEQLDEIKCEKYLKQERFKILINTYKK